MRFDVITLFPEMVRNAAATGVTGRALTRGIAQLAVWNPRDYTQDKHRTVDDRPYGGGPGMVMKVEPLALALKAAKAQSIVGQRLVIVLTPQGLPLSQKLLVSVQNITQLILIAGRYEGIDERFIQSECDAEWSLGDFVISGGELAALVIIDGLTRLLPGVLGDELSALQDSYCTGLLDYPHYTRPEIIANLTVPEVLLSGNHQAIAQWRAKEALYRTWQRRPELLTQTTLSLQQRQWLQEFK